MADRTHPAVSRQMNRPRSVWLAALILPVMLVAMGACRGTADGVLNAASADGPASGGTLRVAISNTWIKAGAASLDPQQDYTNVGWEIMRCCLLRTLMS